MLNDNLTIDAMMEARRNPPIGVIYYDFEYEYFKNVEKTLQGSWIQPKGQLIEREAVPELSELLGTMYNQEGDSENEIRMPDFRGTVVRPLTPLERELRFNSPGFISEEARPPVTLCYGSAYWIRIK